MVSIVIAAENPGSWSIGDYGTVAALISILAFILGALVAGSRWVLRYLQRRKFRDWLRRTEDLNTAFVGHQVQASEQLAQGSSPDNAADSKIDKAVTCLRATVRGVRSDVGLERARDDIERALSIISEASDLYASGTLTWKALSDGPRVNPPGHFTPVLALGSDDGPDDGYTQQTTTRKRTVEALRRELELRVRTARYQLYPGRFDRALHRFERREIEQPASFESHWAVFQRELDDSKAYMEPRWSELEKRLTPP